jgi:hypothetical protein
LARSQTVRLAAWGRITGTAKIGKEPAAAMRLGLLRPAEPGEGRLGVYESTRGNSTQADAAGRFEFKYVRPGERWVTLMLPVQAPWHSNYELVTIESGKATNVTVGGTGRAVVGRTSKVDGVVWAIRRNTFYDASLQPDPNSPRNVIAGLFGGRKHDPMQRLSYQFIMNPDGSFRADDIPAGRYILSIRSLHSDGEYARDVATHDSTITVPPMSDGRSHEPLDLGELKLTEQKYLEPGDAAPLFEAATLDGGRFRLADQKGKVVLMYFWSSGNRLGVGGIADDTVANIRAAQKDHAGDQRLVIVGMNFDPRPATAKTFAAAHDLPGAHAHIGLNSPLNFQYRTGPPGVLLIGPDGKVLETRLSGARVDDALERALRK